MNFTAVVMNLDSRPDRLEQFTQEMNRQGIAFERFPSIQHEVGWYGYNLSIRAVFEKYKDVENLFLFEDDCYFEADFDRSILEELPDGWDGFWLGSNLQSDHHNKVTPRLYRLENGWTTHAVLLSKAFREWCLSTWNGELVFDEWVRVNALPIRKCYVLSPMIAFQRPSHSNIIGGFADYTAVWQHAQNRLK